MIRVLIVEDRAEVRHGLQMRLAAEPDMEVVGSAGDCSAALVLAEDLRPDVVLMDVEMPRQDGIETTYALHRRHPEIPVVILTIYDDTCTRGRAARANAAGFVSKEKPVDYLLATIRDAAGRNLNAEGRSGPESGG
ncbi:MAG: response regulator transcription factor [Nitrososphaerales archaeon]